MSQNNTNNVSKNTTPETLESFQNLISIIERLRVECPWDRKHTHESLRKLLIEETYETIEAIDTQNWRELKSQLGDLLLHIIFHTQIASETESFFLEDVLKGISEKLVRRHPHVFGDTGERPEAEVLQNWEKIKLEEKKLKSTTKISVLEGVPKALPSLVQAQRIQEKAAGVGRGCFLP